MNISEIHQDDQRTKDWLLSRLGHFTGSKIADLMKSGRSKTDIFGDTAKSYLYKVASERDLSFATISDESLWDKYLSLTTATSRAMQFGTDNEGDALDAFDHWLHAQDSVIISGVTYNPSALSTLRGGSVPHPSIANFSASPDSVVYDNATGQIVAVVETKVPLPETYMRYLAEVKDADTLKAVNATYYYQVHAEMMVTGTIQAFFVAYQPFLVHSLHVAPITGNPDTFTAIEQRIAEAETFISAINE